jgi:prepilin-type N-terminal cleavage/methylation domain-containing protein
MIIAIRRALQSRLARLLRSGERGFTLTELITAMGLSVILGTMTLLVFVGLNRASLSTVERSLSASEARNILSSWTSLLQVAESPFHDENTPAFETVTGNELVFYASIDNRMHGNDFGLPTRISVRGEGGTIVEEHYAPDGTGGWQPTPTTRVLASDATVSFSAVDDQGAAVSGSGTQLADVATVRIALAVTDRTGAVHSYDASSHPGVTG